MKKFFAILPLAVWCSAQAQTNIADRAPPPQLVFVKEFIREMHELEQLRVQGEEDLSRARNTNEQLLSFVHWAASVQMASRTSIYILKDVNLNADNHDTPALLAQAHEARIDILEHMKDLDKQILRAPQPGVDYTKTMTDMTEARAALEQLNSSLVQMSALVFATLIDAEHPDSKNHVSYLIISRKERRELVRSLAFTTGPPATNSAFQNAGGVVYDYLIKRGFKCADDRPL